MTSLAMPRAVERLLMAVGKEPAFLADHHGLAASRLMHSFERARLAQRVTMSYDPTRIGGQRGQWGQAELADSAADARQRIAGLARRLPRDCWSVLFDICGFDRGLQEVEAERGWPRRSAKLVLRVALDQLAVLYGLEPSMRGAESAPQRNWLEERPKLFREQT